VPANPVFGLDAVLASSRRREGLDDFGEDVFGEPLAVLLDDYAASDELTESGSRLLRGTVLHSLRMRLRMTEWVRRHPEIAEEVVAPPVVVVGMMRSGTTLVQRLLAADPRFRCAYGWEVLEAAPPLDHDWSAPDPRIDAGRERENLTRTFAPELFATHPMHALEAEEEIVFLADAFLSHVPESGAHLPTYRAWLNTQDFTPAYDHLYRTLQLLQWSKRRRGEDGARGDRRWVLKTPAHLGYLGELRDRFPGLHVVHLHRDPVEVVASGASLNATLHAMHSDHVDLHRVGEQWLERTGWAGDRALQVRAAWGQDPALVTDLAFTDVVADPLGQIANVYAAIGLDLSVEAESAIRAWLTGRPHDPSVRPDYSPERFGLSAEQIEERFAVYRSRFLPR
jgi:hypothetical protein